MRPNEQGGCEKCHKNMYRKTRYSVRNMNVCKECANETFKKEIEMTCRKQKDKK